MIKNEYEAWTTNIERAIEFICSHNAQAEVDLIFQNYGITDIEELDPCFLSEVFNALAAIESNIS